MVRCLTKHTPYHGEFGNMVCQILTIAPYMPEGGWWRNALISALGLCTEYVKILIFLHTCNTPCLLKQYLFIKLNTNLLC